MRAESTVLARAQTLARRNAVTAEQQHLLALAFSSLRASLTGDDGRLATLGCVRLPLLVYAAIRREERPALPLAVALTLLHAGIDLLDDLMDGDLRAEWRDRRPSEVILTAAALIGALPQIALCELDAPPATIVAMQHRLARAGMVMSAGQQYDVASAGRADVSPRLVVVSVAAKSGEAFALATSLAARLAGAPPVTIERYAELGRSLGTALQLYSDCADIFFAGHSRDLTSGTRTLPVAFYLQNASEEERAAFLALLDRARGDPEAQGAVRARLLEADILRECAIVTEGYCQIAHDTLLDCEASPKAQRALGRLIDQCSLVRRLADKESRHESTVDQESDPALPR